MYTNVHTNFCSTVTTDVFGGGGEGNNRGAGINDCSMDTAKRLTSTHAQLRTIESIIDATLRALPEKKHDKQRNDMTVRLEESDAKGTAAGSSSEMPEMSSMCEWIQMQQINASRQRLEQLESLQKELVAIEAETKHDIEMARRKHEETIRIIMNS